MLWRHLNPWRCFEQHEQPKQAVAKSAVAKLAVAKLAVAAVFEQLPWLPPSRSRPRWNWGHLPAEVVPNCYWPPTFWQLATSTRLRPIVEEPAFVVPYFCPRNFESPHLVVMDYRVIPDDCCPHLTQTFWQQPQATLSVRNTWIWTLKSPRRRWYHWEAVEAGRKLIRCLCQLMRRPCSNCFSPLGRVDRGLAGPRILVWLARFGGQQPSFLVEMVDTFDESRNAQKFLANTMYCFCSQWNTFESRIKNLICAFFED